MEYFIVGQFWADTEEGVVWDFSGIFDSSDKAIDACLDNSYFIAPAKLNERIDQEKKVWPGLYYPIKIKNEEG